MKKLTTINKKRLKNILKAFFLIAILFTTESLLSQNAREETISTAKTIKDTRNAASSLSQPLSLSREEIEKINSFINHQMAKWKIPGIAVLIVKGNQTVYQKEFGFADLEKKEPVTSTTLFELASVSKAFTGLAILQLEEKGMLKLCDPVKKYLPWLKMKYLGKEVPITIGHFLYQSTGLPALETLDIIPVSNKDDALEKTVKTLVGWELTVPPGQEYTYTSIAYDVLGLIIREVSGQPYEEYMKYNLLLPLQMNNTYLFREVARTIGMATGYKIFFNRPSAYDAPMYRGNTPAAYIITNARDLGRWLKIQMGTIETGNIKKELIEKSHIPAPNLGSPNYAAGWIIASEYRILAHGGVNPNFSSFIGFEAGKIGVGVLTNMGTTATPSIGVGIMLILKGKKPQAVKFDLNAACDSLSMKIIYILSIFILFNLVLIIISIVNIAKKKRRFSARGVKPKIGFIAATLMMTVLVYLITIMPSLMGYKVSLSFSLVWMPGSFALANLWIFLSGLLIYLLLLSILFFPEKKER